MSKTKQAERIKVPVSKTNFNRVKYQTHTLVDVLTREGHKCSEGGLVVGDEIVRLSLVDLTVRPKEIKPPAPAPKAVAADA